MSDAPTEASEALPVSPRSPGGKLRQSREELEVSLNDVADTLNLTPQVVEAIEHNQFDDVPHTFMRGYVRAYAKLLELDADDLVADYDAFTGHHSETGLVVARPKKTLGALFATQPAWVMGGAVVVLLLVLAVVFSVVSPQQPVQPLAPGSPGGQARAGASAEAAVGSPDAVAATRPAVTASPAPETAVRAPSTAPEVSATAATDPRGVGRAADAGHGAGGGLVAGRNEAGDDGAEAAVTRHASSDGRGVLAFRFTADCWVEVRDGRGSRIFSDLKRTGEQLDLRGEAPFSILLGYGPGASLRYNGQAVALAPHTRNNVAKLVLGQ